jgi:hypothetical protein
MATVLSFAAAHRAYEAPYYDRLEVQKAEASIQHAIVILQQQAGLTCDLTELEVCEMTLERCAGYALAAREFIAELPGTRQSVES